jgi:hypothetical protein
MIRPSGKLNRFMRNAAYQVFSKRTKKKNSCSLESVLPKSGRFATVGL